MHPLLKFLFYSGLFLVMLMLGIENILSVYPGLIIISSLTLGFFASLFNELLTVLKQIEGKLPESESESESKEQDPKLDDATKK